MNSRLANRVKKEVPINKLNTSNKPVNKEKQLAKAIKNKKVGA